MLAQWMMGDIAGLIPSYILVSIKAGQAYLTLVERERPATISAERLVLANMQSMHIELPQGGNGHPRRHSSLDLLIFNPEPAGPQVRNLQKVSTAGPSLSKEMTWIHVIWLRIPL